MCFGTTKGFIADVLPVAVLGWVTVVICVEKTVSKAWDGMEERQAKARSCLSHIKHVCTATDLVESGSVTLVASANDLPDGPVVVASTISIYFFLFSKNSF